MKVKFFIFIVCSLILTLAGCNKSEIPPTAIVELPQAERQSDLMPDEAIIFQDPVIEQAIRSLLKKPDGDITEDDLLGIAVLGDAEGNGSTFGDIKGEISTLSDLKWLKNLKVLSLGDCGIENLDGIEALGELEILLLRRNRISDLSPLRNLTGLTELDLSENPISDTTALIGLINIENLGLSNCLKIDLSSVSGMINLRRLWASYSQITDISMLADKTELEYLQLFHNNIHDISALKNLKKLTYLGLALNNISDITPLDGLENLESVSLDRNPIPKERLEAFYAPKEKDFFTREYRQQISDDMPEYIFELLAFKSKFARQYETTKITVRDAESKEIIQEIFPSKHTYFDETNVTYHSDDLGFIIEDMNFDGYADIRIIEYSPTGASVPYICWVWDKEVKQYVYDSILSDNPSLEVDYENQLIYATGRSSASEHYTIYYQYIDGVLTLIKEVRSGLLNKDEPDQGYGITYELIDGQWVMTSEEKFRFGG